MYHSVVATREGRVISWGRNSEGCLGVGDVISHRNPKIVRHVEAPQPAHLAFSFELSPREGGSVGGVDVSMMSLGTTFSPASVSGSTVGDPSPMNAARRDAFDHIGDLSCGTLHCV
jgi:hypothetical protein